MHSYARTLPLAVLVSLLLSACGERTGNLPDASEYSGLTEAGSSELKAGLPNLGDLPDVERELSLLGPGWYGVNPQSALASNGASPDPAGLTLNGGTSPAYALYAVGNFDGNAYPTSARIAATDLSGEYWVAFADFRHSNWYNSGPFIANAEAEVEYTGEFPAPTDFTARGVCFFAVVAPAGSSLTLTGVELGVHGGDQAPTEPSNEIVSGGANSFLIKWRHSADYLDPDFAGYYIERAPLFSGDFETLNGEPIPDCYFLDSTAVLDTVYRYRIASTDVSGNTGMWSHFQGGPVTGGNAEPIPVLELPQGMLYGPVGITFDLSASFDPDGEPITNYHVIFNDGMPDYHGASPTFSRTFHPGCYLLEARVESATGAGTAQFALKVYPRWRPAPVVINDPPPGPGLCRLEKVRGIRNPADGQLTFFGQDPLTFSLAAWHGNHVDGFELYTHPLYAYLASLCEPVIADDTVLVAGTSRDMHMLYSFDGDLVSAEELAPSVRNAVALATDGQDRLWVLYGVDASPNINLIIRELYPSNPTMVTAALIATVPNLMGLDAVYHPSSGMIDIVYGDDNSVEWARWDPDTAAIDSSGALALATSGMIDVELSPVHDEPAVLYEIALRYRFRERNGVGIWEPETLADNSANNLHPVDLEYSSTRAYCFFGLVPGQAHLYEYDHGAHAWSIRNTPSYSATWGLESVLMHIPGGENMLALSAANDRTLFLGRLAPGDVDGVLWELEPVLGQGSQLAAAAGADGLHAVWINAVSYGTNHFASADGEVWALSADAGFSPSIDLGSNVHGEVYMSRHNFGMNELLYWNGGAWVSEAVIPGSSSYRATLSHSRAADWISWMVYDDGANQLHHYMDNQTMVAADLIVNPAITPVWSATASATPAPYPAFRAISIAGDTSPYERVLGFYYTDAPSFDHLTNPVLPFYNYLHTLATEGKNLGGAFYDQLRFAGINTEVYWASHGRFVWNPVRYDEPLLESPRIVELEMNMVDQPRIARDFRRTVSSATAFGKTALGLVCSFTGEETHFEWSNYGGWEQLRLPEGAQLMSEPEIVVGTNGRWHIVYREFLTGRIMCWSTL